MKDIKGFEGKYAVTEDGKVWSYKSNMFLKTRCMLDGYLVVGLSKNGKSKFYKIHRLVAMTYLDNPDNYPCVNHKDENKLNNNVDNLEWCSYKYNSNYGTAIERWSDKHKKPLYCLETGVTYSSGIEAAKALMPIVVPYQHILKVD